jgi:hypothetical protein
VVVSDDVPYDVVVLHRVLSVHSSPTISLWFYEEAVGVGTEGDGEALEKSRRRVLL